VSCSAIPGVESEGFGKVPDRLPELAFLKEEVAEIGVGHPVVGVEPEGLRVSEEGFRGSPLMGQGAPQAEKELSITGAESNSLLIV